MNPEDIRYWLGQTAHTDHPTRHWDRTCPACVAAHSPREDAIAQAVKTCIGFGFERTNKPPEGHWLMEMWEFGSALRSEAALDAMARDAEGLDL